MDGLCLSLPSRPKFIDEVWDTFDGFGRSDPTKIIE